MLILIFPMEFLCHLLIAHLNLRRIILFKNILRTVVVFSIFTYSFFLYTEEKEVKILQSFGECLETPCSSEIPKEECFYIGNYEVFCMEKK